MKKLTWVSMAWNAVWAVVVRGVSVFGRGVINGLLSLSWSGTVNLLPSAPPTGKTKLCYIIIKTSYPFSVCQDGCAVSFLNPKW